MFLKLLSPLSPKETVVTKAVPQLSFSEQEQLSNIIRRYYPTATKEYINNRTQREQGFEVVLLQEEGIIQAVSYYNISILSTPFLAFPIPVVHFGQAMKKEGYKGDVIWKLGIHYATQKLGWGFPLKKVLGISTIVSPRVYEKFQELYPYSFNHRVQAPDNTALAFFNHYFQEYRGLDIAVGEDWCYTYPDIAIDDITADWTGFYKAKNPAINRMFFEKGILVEQQGRIYKTAKHLVACGYRDVWRGHQLKWKDTSPVVLPKEHSLLEAKH